MAISEISANAMKVLEKRYLAKDENGKLCETVEDLFVRVASAIAKADENYGDDPAIAQKTFYDMMTDLRFLPNSPTLMNAGRPLGQLSACFVLPVADTMEDIFEAVKDAALIHKSGGGTGFSFSRLRQKGATVRSTGGVASGPVSFMRVFNVATEAVKQGGTRRGANMGILRIDHPDILEFIDCKKDNGVINNFNISVGLTEAFMKAVEKGENYDLVDPKSRQVVGSLSAPEVFEKIVDAAWRNGEPGIVFLDRMNKDNVTPQLGEIESTNPCGEQPLLPYESCNLGSINLVKVLKKEKDGSYAVDFDLLRQTVIDAVHFLDNVIDVNNYPLEIIGKTTRSTRKIGLGIMGFADMLLKLGIPYNSVEGIAWGENIMSFIQEEGHKASEELAKKRGTFPAFEGSTLKTPRRNATVTTIAPTGTLSMIAGCSSGVEPVFAYAFIRNIMDGTELVEANGILKEKLAELGLESNDLLSRIAAEGTITHIEELPAELRRVYVCAHDVTPVYHTKMQAAFQRHTDNAVSKTVNFPKEATKEDVAQVYMLAYREGLKGVTIYRDGSREGQVLNIGSVSGAEKEKAEEGALPNNYGHIEPRPRPTVTRGFTEKMRIGCGSLYITTNYDENGICEVFTSTGKAGGCPSQSEATARLVSVALRSGISISEIYDQLKGIRCPSTIRQKGMDCTSCPDAIARVLMKVSKFVETEKQMGQMAAAKAPTPAGRTTDPEIPANSSGIHHCPECGGPVEHEGGCVICRSCGFSKCG
ncbi:MAG: vitamin B12-dependent ribonucleotide reductase [Clostridia bacterium]|nr:vitamin B12-dependent ribonucleotide reductase [Clostridia bacterium]